MPARSRQFKQKESELLKQKQNLWHKIRNDPEADGKNPNSAKSRLYFYRACLEARLALDEFQKEDYDLLVKKEFTSQQSMQSALVS